VPLACRDTEKGAQALSAIAAAAPGAALELAELDLDSLASVESFAAGFSSSRGRLGRASSGTIQKRLSCCG
jgi:hypothetical protein